MQIKNIQRRTALLQLGAWGTIALGVGGLSGCGGTTGDVVGPKPQAPAADPPAPTEAHAGPLSESQRLALASNLEYAAAQFHSYAATGAPMADTVNTGLSATGARRAAFTDDAVANLASQLAEEKQALLTVLRDRLSSAAPAAPAVNLSTTADGAFARIWQAAGLQGTGSFDPYASEQGYLLGAYVLQYGRAATYRYLIDAAEDPANDAALTSVLASAIYHEASIEAQLVALAQADPAFADQLNRLTTALVAIEGSAGAATELAPALLDCSNVQGEGGRPMPFVRTPAQATRLAYLDATGTSGGFLPKGLALG